MLLRCYIPGSGFRWERTLWSVTCLSFAVSLRVFCRQNAQCQWTVTVPLAKNPHVTSNRPSSASPLSLFLSSHMYYIAYKTAIRKASTIRSWKTNSSWNWSFHTFHVPYLLYIQPDCTGLSQKFIYTGGKNFFILE